MRLFFRLLGVQLNQRFGISALRLGLRDNRMRTIGKLALGLIVILSVGSLVGLYAWLVNLMMPSFVTLGMEKLMLGMVLMLAMIMVFFLGLFYILGMLFFAKDTEFLASLPIPQRTVFAAKFGQVLLGEIGVSAILLLPPFIIYGVTVGVGALYWVRMLLVTVLAPCIPLALSALLSLVLMRFSALWRRRDLLTVIGSVLLLVAVFLSQGLLMDKLPEDMSQEALMALLAGSEGLLQYMTSMFPPSGWAATGLANGGGMLWLYAGVSALSLLLVILLAGKIYYSGAMAQLETASNKRAIQIGKHVNPHSTFLALFVREWKTVVRSPVYALNGLVTIIVGPLLLILPKLFESTAAQGDIGILITFMESISEGGLLTLLLAGMFMLIAMINPAVSTSLSREGKNFALLRTLPVTPTKQVMVKYVFGISIALLTMVLMGVSASLALGFPLVMVINAFLLGTLASLAPIALSLLPDILRPKLSWNSETEAIKQNMNAILGMLIGWGYLALIGFGTYLAISGGLSISVIIALIVGVSAVCAALSVYGLSLAARRSWVRIEG